MVTAKVMMAYTAHRSVLAPCTSPFRRTDKWRCRAKPKLKKAHCFRKLGLGTGLSPATTSNTY